MKGGPLIYSLVALTCPKVLLLSYGLINSIIHEYECYSIYHDIKITLKLHILAWKHQEFAKYIQRFYTCEYIM